MNISELAYCLYIEDWKQTHGITRDIEMKNMREYYCDHKDDIYNPTFGNTYRNYIDTEYRGFGCYVSCNEFMDGEYKDESYIKDLLQDPVLIKEYMNDLRIRQQRRSELGTQGILEFINQINYGTEFPTITFDNDGLYVDTSYQNAVTVDCRRS